MALKRRLKMQYGQFYQIEGSKREGSKILNFVFLHKALSVDCFSRGAMQYMYVKDGVATTTDGRRLHQIKKVDLPNGFYEFKKSSSPLRFSWFVEVKDNVGEYPDIERVIPTGDCFETKYMGDTTIPYGGGRNILRFLYSLPEKTGINMQYLIDLGSSQTYNVKWYGKMKAIVFENERRKALIMPFQLE